MMHIWKDIPKPVPELTQLGSLFLIGMTICRYQAICAT